VWAGERPRPRLHEDIEHEARVHEVRRHLPREAGVGEGVVEGELQRHRHAREADEQREEAVPEWHPAHVGAEDEAVHLPRKVQVRMEAR